MIDLFEHFFSDEGTPTIYLSDSVTTDTNISLSLLSIFCLM